MDISNSQFLNLEEHAEQFRLAVNTVRNRILQGTWPARTVKIGKNILVPRSEHNRVINEMLASAGIQPTSGANGHDPQLPPYQTNENPLVGQKRGRGRPRKGEVK